MVLIITSDVTSTVLVALCVILTDLFLSGLIHFWGLTLNPIVMLQIILGIGCSVDFSAHIAYAYLVEDVSHIVSDKASKGEIRRKKAELALSKMGSSVFHGGFSTFVALSVLAPADTYIFVVFYKMWFGIILFGMVNGFLLLPVILSFIGTTETVTGHTDHENDEHETPETPETIKKDLDTKGKKGKHKYVTRDLYLAREEAVHDMSKAG